MIVGEVNEIATKQLIDIIIKATDQASDTARKVNDKFKDIGDSAAKANQKASQASNRYTRDLEVNKQALNKMDVQLKRVGQDGEAAFNELTESEQDALIKFNMLDEETQNLLKQVNRVGNANFSGMITAVNQAKAKYQDLSTVTTTFGGSLDYARSKMQLLGVDTNSLGGKIKVAGSAVKTYLTPAWDSVKNKVKTTASNIKTALSNALSDVHWKVQELGEAFNGLGGVIATSLGVLGMSSISDLTIGLSLSREKMSTLNAAIMGSKESSDALLESIDKATNESVVGMDSMVNAMNKIKLSTQMTNDELAGTQDVVMKLGEASILMGNDVDTATYQMGEAFSGLNGDFTILKENFGITKKKMEDMGWKGDADDIEGYTAALEKCIEGTGDLKSVMDTTAGKIEVVKKKFRTAGRTLGDQLTPYIGQAADAFLDLQKKFPSLAQGLVGLAGGVSIFASAAPTLNQMGISIWNIGGAVKDAAKYLGILEAAEDAATLKADMMAVAHFFGAEAATAETIANMSLTQSFWAMATAILANPLTWVAVALVAIAVAVYEVGKSFGWWTDVSSMLDAIWAGLNRLWSAFINHPDVKGIIGAIKKAWADLQPYVKMVVDWVKSFFKTSDRGKFDVVRALIDAVGAAWEATTLPIRLVIAAVKLLWNAIKDWYLKTKARIELVKAIFRALPNVIKGLISGLLGILTKPFTDAYGKIKKTVDDIKDKAKSITKVNIDSVTDKITSPFKSAYKKVGEWVDKIKKKVKEIPSNVGSGGLGILSQFVKGGVDLIDAGDGVTSTPSSGGSIDVNVNQNLNISLDLANVPRDIDQQMLHNVVVETLTDRDVINQLVSSNDFQTIDNRVKARIIARNNRARGA